MTLKRQKIARPGGELSSRPLFFYWIVDCSGSMRKEKIGALNNAAQSVIPDMKDAAEENPNAQLYIRTLRFSNGACWVTAEAVRIEDYEWEDLGADGMTDMGKAFDLLSSQLDIPPMPQRALPPVLVLMSDGHPTDEYKKPLQDLLKKPWAKKAVRVAISIGRDADDDVLTEFTGNPEVVFKANNATMLTKLIKWASTLASEVSSPASRPEMEITKENGEETGGDGAGQKSEMEDTPAGKYLNMRNIPNPDELSVQDVW